MSGQSTRKIDAPIVPKPAPNRARPGVSGPNRLPTWSIHAETARTLLARSRGKNKQILLITDGEPTAHFEDGKVRFSYPPTKRTFEETLREVVRCTREGITINTFMLARGHYLVDFVNQMSKVNGGRAFYVEPEKLGEFVLIDYVTHKKRRIA